MHLDVCAATIRRWIRQWEARGLKSLRYARMGRPQAVAQRQQVFRALRRCLRRPQVWSSRTLSETLATQGLHLQPRTVRKYLRLMGASYQRTNSCLRHKQDPERVAAARAELQELKKRPLTAISSSFTWTKADSRPLCPPPVLGADPDTAPTSPTKTRRGRRVNVVAALAAPGTTPTEPLTWGAAARTWQRAYVCDFLLYRLPREEGQPRVVVLDNASLPPLADNARGPAAIARRRDLAVLPAALQPGTE